MIYLFIFLAFLWFFFFMDRVFFVDEKVGRWKKRERWHLIYVCRVK